MPHPSQATTADPPADPTTTPPAKKPRGNPNLHLARRCGARTRAGCPCRSPAIRYKLRCRMHGGRSTGPRTPEGLENLRAARTIHGNAGAQARALKRYRLTMLRRNRVQVDAVDYQAHLPPVFVFRLHGHAPELDPPHRPTGGITAAADRMRRIAVAAALAPWKQAIAAARAAHIAARAATHLAKPPAPVRPRPARDAGLPKPPAPVVPRPAGHAAATGASHPPEAPAIASPANTTQAHRPAPLCPALESPHLTALPKPLAPDRAPTTTDTHQPKPHAPIPGRTERAITPCASQPPEAPAAPPSPDATQVRRATPSRLTTESLHLTAAPKLHAPDRAPAPNNTGAAKLHAPFPRLAEPHLAEPRPAEPVIPPDLPNRAARRRWQRLQRRKHAGAATRALPTASR
jgi:hypothetical protein